MKPVFTSVLSLMKTVYKWEHYIAKKNNKLTATATSFELNTDE